MEQNNHEQPSGILLIDKPAGITSHDVIARLRRLTGIRKIGHAGTLDPFATGLLIVAVSRSATKTIDTYMKQDKTYLSIIMLGATTETLDTETPVRIDENIPSLTQEDVQEAANRLTGDIEQIPPSYAAIKVKGKKLYELARKGEEIEVPARPVHIEKFELLSPLQSFEDGTYAAEAEISCSSGTYIRALARDLGKELDTLGYLYLLRRTRIGTFSVDDAVGLDDLTPENWTTYLR